MTIHDTMKGITRKYFKELMSEETDLLVDFKAEKVALILNDSEDYFVFDCSSIKILDMAEDEIYDSIRVDLGDICAELGAEYHWIDNETRYYEFNDRSGVLALNSGWILCIDKERVLREAEFDMDKKEFVNKE